jgi:chromosome segregation ATPase
VFRTRHEVEQLEATIEELRTALAEGWQRRKTLEAQIEALRAEIDELRAAVDQAPTALAAEREALRRQIEDLLGVKALVTEQLAAALNRLHANGDSETRIAPKAGGRVHADEEMLDRVVDTTVHVAVAPLLDFISVSLFERALEAIEQVASARVRRLDGERAIVEVELREAGPLLRWVDGALPFDVDASVVESDHVSLAVR